VCKIVPDSGAGAGAGVLLGLRMFGVWSVGVAHFFLFLFVIPFFSLPYFVCFLRVNNVTRGDSL
jgi:hypothetical protein